MPANQSSVAGGSSGSIVVAGSAHSSIDELVKGGHGSVVELGMVDVSHAPVVWLGVVVQVLVSGLNVVVVQVLVSGLRVVVVQTLVVVVDGEVVE